MRIQVCKDPVTNQSFGRLGYKLVLVWLIFPVLLFLTSLYYGTLTTMSLPPDLSGVEALPLLKDETFYAFLVVIPCVFGLFTYLLRSIPTTFVDLWENKVLQSRGESNMLIEQYNAQLKDVETRINDKKVFRLLYASIPVIVLLSLYGYYKTLTMTYPVVTPYDIRFFPLGGIVFFS